LRKEYAVIPLLAQRRAEVEGLCRRYHVRRLELFGSAASGQDRPSESDLDFLVEFEPLPLGAYADAYFGLLEALQSLSGQPVDLVVGSAIKNPYFRQSVELTKTLLYAA
jgi:predicted nucleotidyltransferase